ncbi:MAG: MBL fold metallo-hydrolase, partial [Desulfobacteraceae bacterium]|nr:MBL fold metallo-hydrolase [Desulfobacteraceae bacterium]
NMSKLSIDPKQIDELVISHDHPDHVGGAMKLIESHPDMNTTLVKSFHSISKSSVQKLGGKFVAIDQPAIITKNCLSTGQMKNISKNEHSLVISTDKGSIVITGCAHPGVSDIAARAKKITGQKILLVMGGFHLMNTLRPAVRKITKQLKDLGVQYVAPSHCTGGEASEVFAEAFGKNFLDSGVGRVITAKDLIV